MISSQAADDRRGALGQDDTEVAVGHGGGLFHVGETPDKVAEVV